jgi:thiol-disulfide isomerase/thioredoxin
MEILILGSRCSVWQQLKEKVSSSFIALSWMLAFIILIFLTGLRPAFSSQEPTFKTFEDLYPGLASGTLGRAVLTKLPKGVLVAAGDLTIKESDLAGVIRRSKPSIRRQLAQNIFYLLEDEITEGLLYLEAAKAGYKSGTKQQVIMRFLSEKTKLADVSEEEIKDFYNHNKDLIGNAPLEELRGLLKEYLTQQKGEEAVRQYIMTIGKRVPIQLSEVWVKKQKGAVLKNPVDRARLSGKPTMVEFGAPGCTPCDMMAPILADLKKKFGQKINILSIHTGEEQVLGDRFGIQAIPVQVFFNPKGREVFRHTGFFPQTELETKIAQLGWL